MKNKLLLTSAIVISTATSFAVADNNNAQAGNEKCYGVSKAGKNDCHSKDGSHSCAGLASEDNSPNEWVFLPEGVCDKLTGGIKG